MKNQISEFLLAVEQTETRRTYANACAALVEFLEHEKQRPARMADLNNDVLRAFRQWLVAKRYASLTRKTYLAGVRAFLRFALYKEWTPGAFSLERANAALSLTRKRESYPTKEDVGDISQVATYWRQQISALPPADGTEGNRAKRLTAKRNLAFALFLLDTASREGAARSLKRKHVGDGSQVKRIEVKGKGDKKNVLYISSDETRAALHDYLSERNDTFEGLFVSHEKRGIGRPISANTAYLIFRNAGDAMGVSPCHPHLARHWRLRQMNEQRVPLTAISRFANHSSPGVTGTVYAITGDEDVERYALETSHITGGGH